MFVGCSDDDVTRQPCQHSNVFYTYETFIELNVFYKGEGQQNKALFRSLLLRRAPPPFVVPWESEILGPYLNVVVDAKGPETDFTLETNRKRVKEKLLKTT